MIINQIVFLICIYNRVKDEFNKLYNIALKGKKISKHRTQTSALKEELFVTKYARECSIKPISII